MITEEASAALRKANKWAQSGLIVSVGPPVETLAQETAAGITAGDKKKTAQTAVCRDRNAELARCCFCDLDMLYKSKSFNICSHICKWILPGCRCMWQIHILIFGCNISS